MAYSQNFVDRVARSPKTLGNKLGRWAMHREISVQKIASALNVSRQTVYNWFAGKEVFVAYKDRVESLLKILQAAETAEQAWSMICKEYNLQP